MLVWKLVVLIYGPWISVCRINSIAWRNYRICFGKWPKVLSFLSFLVPLSSSSISSKIGSVVHNSLFTSLLSGFIVRSLLMIQEPQKGLDVIQNLFHRIVPTYGYRVWGCTELANFTVDCQGWRFIRWFNFVNVVMIPTPKHSYAPFEY